MAIRNESGQMLDCFCAIVLPELERAGLVRFSSEADTVSITAERRQELRADGPAHR
jgi:hypothetical protein